MDIYTQQKRMLVDAILLLERTGMIDFNGHASWCIPGEDRMLINAGASVRSALTIDDIVMTDSMNAGRWRCSPADGISHPFGNIPSPPGCGFGHPRPPALVNAFQHDGQIR
jgi:hypothetical protein